VDKDGVFKNSPVVTATVSGKGRILLFQNSPNPFRGTATIRFDLPTAQKVRLSILDILGREVKVLTNKQSEAGSHLIPVDATGLSRQLYYIRLQTESGTLTRNMLVE
jgi:Secretion system C-terminal sorting domain